jgi:hypothetical protein
MMTQHLRVQQTLFYLFIGLLFAGLTACSDDLHSPGDASGAGTLTLTVSCSNLRVTNRAALSRATETKENYVEELDLYLFTGDDEDTPSVCNFSYSYTDGFYYSETLEATLTGTEVNKLFPDTVTYCTAYIVANVHSQVKDLENPTLSVLKQVKLETNFTSSSFDPENTIIPMDGLAKLKVEREKWQLSGSIELKRAWAKVSMNLKVDSEVTSNGKNYEPVTENIQVSLVHAYTQGRLGQSTTTDDPTPDSYLKIYSTGSKTSDDEDSQSYYPCTQKEPFCTYAAKWNANDDAREPKLLLRVPWKEEDASNYDIFYYQISLNTTTMELLRNHYYKINLHVGRLGSTVESTPTELTSYDYEILDWGNYDSASIGASLSSTHYLVVEDNSFTVDNEDEISFDYMACTAIQGVYLTEVSYESTKYTDSDGNATTVYLYRTNYTTDGEYIPYSDDEYDDNSTKVRADNTDVVDYLKNGLEIIYSKEAEGEITLKSKVSETAGKIYRPLTYKLVVVGDPEHGGGIRHTVTIKQYPSQYIEFGNAGNVFVNGYYARVKPDDGYSASDLPYGDVVNSFATDGTYYRSYGISTANFTKASKTETLFGTITIRAHYWSTSLIDTGLDDDDYDTYGCTPSGYEHVRADINTADGISLKKTVKVHLTAFSSTDHTFKINSDTKEESYIIGNPRQEKKVFTALADARNNYNSEGNNELRSYTIDGGHGNNTSYCYRYVESWNDVVGDIKIGGETTYYDPIIAPVFMMQSGYGMAHKAFSNYYKARKRCATYQEAGYPAGRWRLPTLAEIAFMVRLQNEGAIDGLFTKADYWTSSGGVIKADETMEYKENQIGSDTEAYVRCVYDLWYYGDTPEKPTHQFYAKPNL